jgi:hypothetical protein
MALVTCEYCKRVMREEAIDAHEIAQHPHWAVNLEQRLMDTNKLLERIASALEGLERR